MCTAVHHTGVELVVVVYLSYVFSLSIVVVCVLWGGVSCWFDGIVVLYVLLAGRHGRNVRTRARPRGAKWADLEWGLLTCLASH